MRPIEIEAAIAEHYSGLDAHVVELGALFRSLRRSLDLTLVVLSTQTGINFVRLSRIERGQAVLRVDELRLLLHHLQPDEMNRKRALTLFSELQSDPVLWRLPNVEQKGSVSSQLQYISILEGTLHLRVFCSTLINGLLQTRDYARANMRRELEMTGALSQLDEACLAKAKVQECLYDAERSFDFVIHESSFFLTPTTPDVMAIQAEKLIDLSMLPNVNIYFVSSGTPMSCPAHYDFVVFDDVMVLLEMWPTVVAVKSPTYVEFCLKLHERLIDHAARGDDARCRLRALAERLLDGAISEGCRR